MSLASGTLFGPDEIVATLKVDSPGGTPRTFHNPCFRIPRDRR
jgi:hypothetical protein